MCAKFNGRLSEFSVHLGVPTDSIHDETEPFGNLYSRHPASRLVSIASLCSIWAPNETNELRHPIHSCLAVTPTAADEDEAILVIFPKIR